MVWSRKVGDGSKWTRLQNTTSYISFSMIKHIKSDDTDQCDPMKARAVDQFDSICCHKQLYIILISWSWFQLNQVCAIHEILIFFFATAPPEVGDPLCDRHGHSFERVAESRSWPWPWHQRKRCLLKTTRGSWCLLWKATKKRGASFSFEFISFLLFL